MADSWCWLLARSLAEVASWRVLFLSSMGWARFQEGTSQEKAYKRKKQKLPVFLSLENRNPQMCCILLAKAVTGTAQI